jgi:hypothetical protein
VDSTGTVVLCEDNRGYCQLLTVGVRANPSFSFYLLLFKKNLIVIYFKKYLFVLFYRKHFSFSKAGLCNWALTF